MIRFISVFLLGTSYSAAMSQCEISKEKCLSVFDRAPAGWPKCYCTDLCQDDLESLRETCTSGEAHWDDCGVCLRCAKARGQRCGGMHNIEGVCASGLACKIDLDSRATESERQKKEQSSVGICVSDRSDECPKSRLGGDEQRKRVNCRPGTVGILLEALYCPVLSNECPSQEPSTRRTIESSSRRAFIEGLRPPSSFIQLLLSFSAEK